MRSGACRSADPMDIALRFIRQLKINHVGHIIYINAPRRNICCNQNLNFASRKAASAR